MFITLAPASQTPRSYDSILQRLSASASVTLVHWRHSNARHNWASLHAGSGNLEAHVNKFVCQHMDAAILLQLMTGPLRAVSSQIALRDIALDPSAFSSPLITRVFYSVLPETSAEQACRNQYVYTSFRHRFL